MKRKGIPAAAWFYSTSFHGNIEPEEPKHEDPFWSAVDQYNDELEADAVQQQEGE